MKVCVYGAGPVGCFVAAQLAAGGADTVLVARGATLDAIAAHGLHVSGPGHALDVKVRVTDRPAALGPQDVVVVCVKTHQLPSIAEGLAALLGPGTGTVFLQNGIPWWYFHGHGGPHDGTRLPDLDPGGVLWRTVGPDRALGGVILAACDLVRPGAVHVETARPLLVLGEADGARTGRVTSLAAAAGHGLLRTDASATIRQTIWGKLQLNVCSGLLGCLADAAPGEICGDPAVAAAVWALAAEVGAVAAAFGFDTGVDGGAILARIGAQKHKSSIVQDLAHGRPMEIATMFAAPRELARLAGVPVPTLALLTALVEARAGGRAGTQGG